MRIHHIILCFILLLTACEEAIELDLNPAETQLVVEAEIRNQPNSSFVKLSQTTDFYDNNEFNLIENATVTIREEGGVIWNLSETRSGFYENEEVIGEPGKTYLLTIETNGQTYTATSTMPTFIAIDSLSVTFNDANAFLDEGFQVDCHFQDPLTESNFYKWRLYEDGKPIDGIFIWDDDVFNGNSARYPFFRERFATDDSVSVELFSVGEADYSYLLGLEQIAGGGGGPGGSTAAPGNPVTNLSGDAVGYFGAYGYDQKSVIIKD